MNKCKHLIALFSICTFIVNCLPLFSFIVKVNRRLLVYLLFDKDQVFRMATCSKNIDYTREDVDYDSTYEDDEDTKNAKKARRDLADKPKQGRKAKVI